LVAEVEMAQAMVATSVPVIAPRPAGATVPATRAQRHILLDIVRGTDGLAYHEPMVVDFRTSTRAEAIVHGFRQLLARHEALRASFDNLESEPVQHFHAAIDPFLPSADLSHLSGQALEAAIRTIALGDAALPFSLDRPPLLRARIIATGPDRHRLALTIHHALFDGRSLINALSHELPILIEAAQSGAATPLPPPPAQYGDLAVAEAAATNSDWGPSLDYWRSALAGGASSVTLPADHVEANGARHSSGIETITIPQPLSAAIERMARDHATSPYAVMLAGLFAQVRRYGSTDDLTIGSVVDTRASSALADMVGYCINSIALRVPVSLQDPFPALIDRVADTLCAGYEHGAVPFDLVMQTLGGAMPGADNGRFHLLFSSQPAPSPDVQAIAIDYLPPPAAKADLFFEVESGASDSHLRCTYDTALFEAATVQMMLGHWQHLMHSAMARPDAVIAELGLIDDGEARALAQVRAGPAAPIPALTLTDLIDQTIARTPDAIAVIGSHTRWRYAELDRRADAIAAGLQGERVKPGDLVALWLTRTPAMVAAILGILRAGAAYVPIDPSFPPARLAMILDDARPAAVIVDAATIGSFTDQTTSPLPVEDLMTVVGKPTRPPRSSRDLAYIIYTSGSTGVPKGVEIEHRGVVNVVAAMREALGFGSDDVMLALARLTFDMSVPDIFLPLTTGGVIAVAPSETIADPMLLAAFIEQVGATVMQATPATWQSLIADGWPGRPQLTAISGGEALGRALADELLDRGMRVFNGYGPTESSVYITIAEIRPNGVIDIGRPIANIETLIVDDAGQEVPFNVPGHLLIAGIGLARRYRDAELTRRAFILRADQRWYRSGDIAVRRRDGRIEWLGRNDGQIKIRGFRIDIGDVEAAICTCPGIALAGVAAIDADRGMKDLAAFVVPRGGVTAPDFATLRQHLAGILPKYMIPTRYAVLDAMPLSSSGKIQRSVLATMADRLQHWSIGNDLPVGETENAIAAHWCAVLGLDRVGATDDFFDLGGHSLLAARLIGRLSAAFDLRLPLATLTRAPTVRQLAALIEADAVQLRAPDTITIGDGAGPPLFWIDATPNFRANGFRDFAAVLAGDARLIGLPVDTERFAAMPDHGAIRKITAAMADAMLAAEPNGPYRLGGWCNGALLALFVADELVARGKPVDAVVMLDAANQAGCRRRSQRLRREIMQLFQVPADERRQYVREWIGGYTGRLRRRVAPAGDEADALHNLTDRFMRVLRDTDLPAYDGRVILIYADGGAGGRGGLAQWQGVLAGPIDTLTVRGGHESILHPPYVNAFATQLITALSAMPAQPAAEVRPAPSIDYSAGIIGTSPV
jgi:amino acid adenylation domain-containing protein